jgi:hypothetical protein
MRHTGADRDRTDAHVAVVDVPTFVTGFKIAAAGEIGHGGIKAPCPAAGNRSLGLGLG